MSPTYLPCDDGCAYCTSDGVSSTFCSAECDVDEECQPAPEWAKTAPICKTYFCALPCASDNDCADGQSCLGNMCWWPNG